MHPSSVPCGAPSPAPTTARLRRSQSASPAPVLLPLVRYGSLANRSSEAVVRSVEGINSRKKAAIKGNEIDPSLVEHSDLAEVSLQETAVETFKEETLLKEWPERGQQDAVQSTSCYPRQEVHDTTESFWEEGIVTVSDLQHTIKHGCTVEFTKSPSANPRKTVRRTSAAEKELAELVHKVHLLCLLARGRLIDNACSDPLIQASLLSLLPQQLLKVTDEPKLTVKALSPLVKWFHDNFHVGSSSTKEGSFNLAFAVGRHEGSAEEVVALSVALFRALNLPARYVSILDAASLKPPNSSGSSCQDESILDTRVSSGTNLVVSSSQGSWLCPPGSSSTMNCQKEAEQMKTTSLGSKETVSTNFPTTEKFAGKMVDASSSKEVKSNADTSLTVSHKETKRKGDLEFELQLEMALSATRTRVLDYTPASCSENTDILSKQSQRYKKLKTESGPPQVSTSENQGTVWSRKVGPPVCWSEVYCSGENMSGRWVHVDVVSAIIDGEQKIEAASAACRRPLRYVAAFAGNGAKDVTRRYCTQWYKVAPHRVHSEWWDAVLAPLKDLESISTGGTVHSESHSVKTSQSHSVGLTIGDSNISSLTQELPVGQSSAELCQPSSKKISVLNSLSSGYPFTSRSSLEDVELETRALTEPLPTNQLAYRNHPLYVIEKWLTKYQALYPKGPLLGYCTGHPVYPRSSVQTLQTKQRWLRDGLQVKTNEIPAKIIKRTPKSAEVVSFESGVCEEDRTNIELYGKWQMEPLCLPHAVNGIVPKNERGQVELWSEKCLPHGTIHLRLPRIVPVAKRLEVDFAPAMVGFEFRNGRSFPVFEGIVVCSEFRDSVLAAHAEEEARREAEEKKWSEAQALSRWYQLISSMVTRQRLSNSYEGSTTFHPPHHVPEPKANMPKTTSNEGGKLHTAPSSDDLRNRITVDDHEHVFPLEDQSFDEESSVRTKRCPCGFSIQMEEL